MSNRPVSLKDFLEKRHLTRKDNTAALAKARARIEQSRMLEIMQDLCAEINREAHTVLVEAQSYLPPEELVRTFAFVEGGAEYIMQIELWGPKPALVFLVRKWRDTSSNPLVRWVHRLAETAPFAINVKFASLIEERNLTKSEIEQWYFYLLSRLSHEFIPSGPSLRVSEDGAPDANRETIAHTARATWKKTDGIQPMPPLSQSRLRDILRKAE